MSTLQTMVDAWGQEAAKYEADGQPGAKLLARCARELQAYLSHGGDTNETVTVTEAAQRCGYSAKYLYVLVDNGTLTNYGTDRRLRLKVVELPRKPGGRSSPGPFQGRI